MYAMKLISEDRSTLALNVPQAILEIDLRIMSLPYNLQASLNKFDI